MIEKNCRIVAAVTSALLILLFAHSYGGDNSGGNAELRPVGGITLDTDTCAGQRPGDVDGDGQVGGVGDIVFLVSLFYQGGPAPFPLSNGDVNGDCVIDLDDLYCLQNSGFCIPVLCTCVEPTVVLPGDTCASQYPGDLNNSGDIDISDLVFLVNYMFKGGTPPSTPSNADINGDCELNISDLVYLVAYMFEGGPPPVDCTCLDPIMGAAPAVSLKQLCLEVPALAKALGDDYRPAFTLHKNYPNPFNPTTQISFSLTGEAHATLNVFNIAGQLVTTLVDRELPAGEHVVSWDGRNSNNSPVASGIYLYRLSTGDVSRSERMILLK